MELRRFQRVALRAGESKTVRFTIGMDDLALYDANMKRVAEPGYFRVYTGGNSRDVQDARFKLSTPDDKPIAVPETCH